MDVCVLSSEEVGRLIHYKLNPNHKDHIHIPSSEALKGVTDDMYELVDTGARQYVTRTKLHFLARRKSGCIDTIQRVVSNHLLELKPIR